MSKENEHISDDMDHMVRIDTMIADLQKISDQFGNTCVYIRRGGISWGAVALNRRSDDEKHGVFDLQAQHDRDMTQRAEQVQRLKADRDAHIEEDVRLRKLLIAIMNYPNISTYVGDEIFQQICAEF